jgi:hypothetical protein
MMQDLSTNILEAKGVTDLIQSSKTEINNEARFYPTLKLTEIRQTLRRFYKP